MNNVLLIDDDHDFNEYPGIIFSTVRIRIKSFYILNIQLIKNHGFRHRGDWHFYFHLQGNVKDFKIIFVGEKIVQVEHVYMDRLPINNIMTFRASTFEGYKIVLFNSFIIKKIIFKSKN